VSWLRTRRLGPVTSRMRLTQRKITAMLSAAVHKKDGKFYNSSVLMTVKEASPACIIKRILQKPKFCPTRLFKGGARCPGQLNQPVIETDFGKVGMQICFDANWNDGWENLRKRAQTRYIFIPVSGGRMLNHYALKNNYYIVSSTGAMPG